MNKISKLFCAGLALLSQSMCLVFGTSNIDNTQTAKHIEQSMISSEKDHKEESLVGNYVGWYQENRRIHGMNLDIIENNGICNAVFKFYPYSYSSDTSSGSFSMTIEKNKDSTYNFIQNEWIDKPDEYDMVDLLNCTVSNSTISGGVFLRSDSDIEKREIGYMFATTIEEEIYGKYESWYWDGEKKHDLRQDRINGDKKEQRKQPESKSKKRQESTCFHCTEQTVIRPRGQNAYQRDRGLQEQTKNSI